jgi:hypothetical protein
MSAALADKYYSNNEIKEDEVGGACSAHKRDKKYIFKFDLEAKAEDTACETKA